MKKESALFGLIGLCLGSLLTIAIVFTVRTAGRNMGWNYLNDGECIMMRNKGTYTMSNNYDGMTMGMDEMADKLKNKKGNEFDETFLKLMIDHHRGAINMAKEATTEARHEELKTFSENIIQAQSQEIDSMKAWLIMWGMNK